MRKGDDSIRRTLSRQDREFRALMEEHRRHELRLEELSGNEPLSPDEEREAREIKKQKLHLKDRMESRVRSWKENRTV